MSTLFNPGNAPRDLNSLSQMSNAVLYRLAMQLSMFRDDEEKERAFVATSAAEKAPLILERLHEIDNNPQAAAAMSMPMTLPQQAPQQYQEPMSYQPPPGTPGQFQAQLPQFQGQQPNLPFNGPPGYAPQGAPTMAPPAPPGPPQGNWGPPPAAPSGPPPMPGGQPWQGGAPTGAPGYPPPGFAQPAGPPQFQQPPPPPGPPQGGWAPPGGPMAPPAGPPMAAPATGGWTPPGVPGGPPLGGPAFAPPGAQQPPRNPSTPSDPNNQGTAAQQLLDAINGLATELARQNTLLAGVATLAESNFIVNVIMAERMQITQAELAHRVGAERDAIKRQFLPQGKA